MRLPPPASLALASACLALAGLPPQLAAALEWDRAALAGGQLWRLFSCHLVHFSAEHALGDGAVLLIAGALAERRIGTRALALRLALAAPAVSLGLLLAAPGMERYRGASGLDAMLCVTAGAALWRETLFPRAPLLALAGALALKTAAEACGWSIGWSGLPDGVALAWQAHALGIACAALMAWRGTGRP